MGDGRQFRSPYNYDLEAASNESAYVETMPSLTVQSMSEDADLNVMLKRFGVTGQMPQSVRLPSYGDFTGITDFRSALEALTEAEDSFMSLPADLRAKFENNPQLLLDFVENPANIEQVKELFGEKNVRSSTESVGNAAQAAAPVSGAPGGPAASSSGGTPGNAGGGKPAPA